MKTIHFDNQVVIVISKNVATLNYLNSIKKTYNAEITLSKDNIYIMIQKPITINLSEGETIK